MTSVVHFNVGLRKLPALHYCTVDCQTCGGVIMNVGKSGYRLMEWSFNFKTKYEGYVLKTMVLADAVFSQI